MVDMAGMTTSHATMISPGLLKKLVVVFLEAFPMDNDTLVELSKLYFLNMPKILEKLFSIFLSFLNKKLRKTIKVEDSVSKAMLEDLGEEKYGQGGKEYGGAEGEGVEKEEGESGGERREGGRRCGSKEEGERGSFGSRLIGICS